MMGDSPQSIITDEQKTIQLGLNKLRENRIWMGVHLYDSFHIIKNLKKKTRNIKVL